MEAQEAAAALVTTAAAILTLCDEMTHEQARWKPSPETWSILEVVCHLDDEERDDFRLRLRLTLEDPEREWTPIDPQGWAVSRRYNERELLAALASFRAERAASLEWLGSLVEPDWERSRTAPWGGVMRAGDLLAAWVEHDLIHLRQLVRLRHQWLLQRCAPYRTEYAGEW
ncbi:MAG: DinB family protein [Armatimonadetes bacterium]|nr:DinB family protein [Armatimonadota bacterium]